MYRGGLCGRLKFEEDVQNLYGQVDQKGKERVQNSSRYLLHQIENFHS